MVTFVLTLMVTLLGTLIVTPMVTLIGTLAVGKTYSNSRLRVRIGGTCGDLNPLNKVRFERTRGLRRVPFKGSP